MNIIYIGYNSFNRHKRGVENVIITQKKASTQFTEYYYIHLGSKFRIYEEHGFTNVETTYKFFDILRLNILVRKLVLKEKTLIHSHNPIITALLHVKTSILTVHDSLTYLHLNRSFIIRVIFYVLEKISYSRSRVIHVISEFTRKNSLLPSNSKNIINIPNTILFEEDYTGQCIVNPSVKNHPPIIGIIRSIEKRARIDLIIELSKKYTSTHFKIVGKGPLLNFYIQKIRDENISNVEFLGFISHQDLVKFYLGVDVVMVTADSGEGFGLPIIEAYHFNKPVIASNVCAIPEFIYKKEFLFENNIKSISKVLDYALGQLEKKQEYRKYYLKKFSNKIIYNEYRKLYESLL